LIGGGGYKVITPDTSLDELEEFLQEHNFAVGMVFEGEVANRSYG
jgi:hypothetical protein